ncbi:hypothetical protein C8R46DRAFT_1244697 [Mycena filopes]|nr:hypothetical protein C8R46DRAFT_1244697 [Mycena filopes]
MSSHGTRGTSLPVIDVPPSSSFRACRFASLVERVCSEDRWILFLRPSFFFLFDPRDAPVLALFSSPLLRSWTLFARAVPQRCLFLPSLNLAYALFSLSLHFLSCRPYLFLLGAGALTVRTGVSRLGPMCVLWYRRRSLVDATSVIVAGTPWPARPRASCTLICYGCLESFNAVAEVEVTGRGPVRAALETLSAEKSSLESYREECLSVFSPVRRLPTELLAQIFDLCAPSTASLVTSADDPADELERVARKYLLDLSQVCSRWHEVAMNTPRLWSTVALDTCRWDACSASTETLLSLVGLGLNRSGEHPLTLSLAVADDPVQSQILELVAKHSLRWIHLDLWGIPEAFRFLAAAKGNMPLLRGLWLTSSADEDVPYAADIFEIAPRLREVSLFGWPSILPRLPWALLTKLVYDNRESNHFTLAMLPKLSPDAASHISLDSSILVLPLDLPPITAHVFSFTLDFTSGHHDSVNGLLNIFLERLTLHRLRRLDFVVSNSAEAPAWSQHRFLDFAARSSFHTTLTMLSISALIKDTELVNCLAVFPSLEELHVWDYNDGFVVMTDSLLDSLTWTVDGRNLVPRLNSIDFNSAMEFTNAALLQFVTSRAVAGRFDPGVVFNMALSSVLEEEYIISPDLVVQLAALKESGVLRWSYCPF